MLSMIVAAAENNVIGKDNQLLWHLPDDLKHFKRTTQGHHVISGRKTYESQGRPLPKRTNIIITRNKDFHAEGCLIAHSLDDALNLVHDDDEPFIIGGEAIYRMAMDRVDRIYLTRIHARFEGDTWFPEIDMDQWIVIGQTYHGTDEKHNYPFTIFTLDRKQNRGWG